MVGHLEKLDESEIMKLIGWYVSVWDRASQNPFLCFYYFSVQVNVILHLMLFIQQYNYCTSFLHLQLFIVHFETNYSNLEFLHLKFSNQIY